MMNGIGQDEPLGLMTDDVFEKLSGLFREECGINLTIAKKKLLEGRLQRRMNSLGFHSFDAYYDFLMTSRGRLEELPHAIDAVTTNKTDFFREEHQFDYLLVKALPDCCKLSETRFDKQLHIWSAACSSGEEPYTLAMVLAEYVSTHPGVTYSILATDICNRILQIAREGIYAHHQIEPVPLMWRRKYLLRGRHEGNDLVKIAPEIRARVRFERLNLISEHYGIAEQMDVIFCRNVIIYFDKPTQRKVMENLCRQLAPGGYLFMGHAETLNGMDLPLSYVSANIYRKGPAPAKSRDSASSMLPDSILKTARTGLQENVLAAR